MLSQNIIFCPYSDAMLKSYCYNCSSRKCKRFITGPAVLVTIYRRLRIVEMTIPTNSKPAIYRNLYQNTRAQRLFTWILLYVIIKCLSCVWFLRIIGTFIFIRGGNCVIKINLCSWRGNNCWLFLYYFHVGSNVEDSGKHQSSYALSPLKQAPV